MTTTNQHIAAIDAALGQMAADLGPDVALPEIRETYGDGAVAAAGDWLLDNGWRHDVETDEWWQVGTGRPLTRADVTPGVEPVREAA